MGGSIVALVRLALRLVDTWLVLLAAVALVAALLASATL